MMKKTTLLLALMFLANGFVQAQTDDCRCNDIFDKDIRTEFNSYNRAEAKRFMYDYFQSDKKKRKEMKRSNSNSFGISTVVESLPLDFSGSNQTNSNSSFLYQESLKAITTGFVSDAQINSILTTYISNRAWDSYDKCLELCGQVILDKSGVKIIKTYESDDKVQIKVSVRSIPGDKLTIRKVNYLGGQAVGGQTFQRGTIMREGQTLFEDINREQGKDLIISISFEESWIDGLNYVSRYETPTIPGETPIGMIIASILPYRAFLEANEQKYTADMSKAVWIPCDGRSISTTQGYGKFTGGTVPDLRGVFIRGINNMGDENPTVSDVAAERANPENKKANEFQDDELQSHSHGYQAAATHDVSASGSRSRFAWDPANYTTGSTGGAETRPKNVTVYYYIKIN